MDELVKLIGKLSKYEILNNLLPGAVMCYLLSLIGYSLWQNEWFLNVVISYVIGMICSRFSSLCIEWLFRKCKFIQWRKYDLYNKAKKGETSHRYTTRECKYVSYFYECIFLSISSNRL